MSTCQMYIIIIIIVLVVVVHISGESEHVLDQVNKGTGALTQSPHGIPNTSNKPKRSQIVPTKSVDVKLHGR